MMLTTRYHAITTAVAITCLVLFGSCSRETAEEVESETPVAVKTVEADVGEVRGLVHATGIVNPAPDAELVVIAPEAARIVEIPRAAGDRVRRGDILVRFEIPSSTAEVLKQQAELTRAEATLENARAAQTRASSLFERGVAARREVEDANRSVAEAEAALAQARASLTSAETVATRSTVRATFDGVVARRFHNPGDVVEPSAGDPVLRIIDLRRLEIVAAVPLADAPRVEIGATAHLVGSPSNAQDAGLKIVSRPAQVEPGTASIPVRIAFTGPVNIPVGSPVQVDIDAEHHTNVVVIPAVAIVREGDDTSVFVASGGKAMRRHVQLGITDGARVEIMSGVMRGDKVIVDGQAGLPDEAPITEGSAAGETAGETETTKDTEK